MSSHFRTAVLAIVLAGGTLASYVTAYAVMGVAPAGATASGDAPSASPAGNLAAGRTDLSVEEACAAFASADDRNRCKRAIAAPPRAIRIIDFASTEANTVVR